MAKYLINKKKSHQQLGIVTLVFFLFLHLAGYSQIQKEFTSRFNETVNGDVTMIANNMLSRTATENYHDESDNHDFIDNMYVDIDNDDSTFNSSSANFINPQPQLACVSILKAYIYWAAADKEKENGEDNQPNWNFNDIKLILPGESTYSTITADEIIYRGRDSHFSSDPYICFKDITSSILNLSSPYGTYQVANVEAKTGYVLQHDEGNIGTSGGWQIVFVYQSPELPTKNISLFDGYAHVSRAFNNFDINFNGFQTVPTGAVNANIVFGSLEGDRILRGDQFQIKNSENNFVDLTAPLRDSDNFFNSRITIGNMDYIDRNPSSTNTLGFDAAVFTLENPNNMILDNNQTSTTIRLTSNQETYGLYLLGLSVDVRSPNLYPIILNSTAIENRTNAGETVLFDFNFSNTGNDDAINVFLSTIIPSNVEFIDVNNLPNGVSYTYDIDTRILLFILEDGLTDVGDSLVHLQFELRIKDACYFIQENCDLSFGIQLEATYNGSENPIVQTSNSSYTLDECQLGTSLPISINMPSENVWISPIGDLDRDIICEDPEALRLAQSLIPETGLCDFTLTKKTGEFIPNSSLGYSGTYTNTWSFTDACGRTNTEYIQVITINDDCLKFICGNINKVKISKAVTANGDQWNEYFVVGGQEACGFPIDVQIFNRWGAIVYRSNDYKNDWNGFSNNNSIEASKNVPSGTYYYIAHIKGSGLKPFTGALYVSTE